MIPIYTIFNLAIENRSIGFAVEFFKYSGFVQMKIKIFMCSLYITIPYNIEGEHEIGWFEFTKMFN
jgi:hypothetical protein